MTAFPFRGYNTIIQMRKCCSDKEVLSWKPASEDPWPPFYAVAVLWLAWGILAPLYAPLHYILAAAASGAVFAAVSALCRSGAVGQQAETEQTAPKQEAEPSTGNAELDKMLKDGRLAIAEMKRLDDNIADPGISADIVRLEQVSQKIFDEVKRDPGKLPQIRKFMDYYLPTTLKMVRGFRTLDERGVTGAQAQDARRRIGDALDVVIHGCQRLLENLYRDDVLDLTTDIDVLEQMLKRDGLTESDLERAAAQAREAARIDAEANRISRERAARGNVSAQGGQASATATRPNDRT